MAFGNIRKFTCLRGLAALLLLAASTCAQALPSFARQTGFECTTCHVSWPELTPIGREFKLSGYTLGDRQKLPFAGMLTLSRSSTSNVDPSAPDNFEKDREFVLQEASLFLGGKLTDHVGTFAQATWDGVERHAAVDNVDIRYADRTEKLGGVAYGLTLHNNPTVQDIYNTGPAWGFPFASSPVAPAPSAATALESLGQQVAGVGAYALWRDALYTEFSAYRTADGVFSPLRAGTDRSEAAALKGWNPYVRLALQHEWDDGRQSGMIGTYGMTVDRYPDNTMQSGPTDRFRDVGIDAQYQYITDAHRISLQVNYLREQQHWNATAQSNPSDTLRTFRAKATYYYQKKYGITLGYFSINGDADAALYNTGEAVTGSANGSPDSAGTILELNYLPKRDIRLAVQYMRYSKFNGAGTNYDGFGRNASDNNTLFLLAWFMF